MIGPSEMHLQGHRDISITIWFLRLATGAGAEVALLRPQAAVAAVRGDQVVVQVQVLPPAVLVAAVHGSVQDLPADQWTEGLVHWTKRGARAARPRKRSRNPPLP